MKLDLGCGARKRPGYLGVDRLPLDGVDLVMDLDKKFILNKNAVTEINCHNVLEHVKDLDHTMKEIWRVCKPGAIVHITVPHFSGYLAFYEYHVRFFNVTSFIDFTEKQRMSDSMIKGKFEIKKCYVTFPKWGIYKLNYLIERLVNISNKSRILYDETFLHSLFPACGIEFELEVIK